MWWKSITSWLVVRTSPKWQKKTTFFLLVTLTFDLVLSNTIPNCVCPRSTHIPNLVNLGRTRLELSHRQKCYRRTDTGDNNTLPVKRPKGKNNYSCQSWLCQIEVRITKYDEKYGGVSEWISLQLSLGHSVKFLSSTTINSAAIHIPGPMDYGIFHLSIFHNNNKSSCLKINIGIYPEEHSLWLSKQLQSVKCWHVTWSFLQNISKINDGVNGSPYLTHKVIHFWVTGPIKLIWNSAVGLPLYSLPW